MHIGITGIGGLILLALDIWAMVSVIGSDAGTGKQGALGARHPDPAAHRLRHLVHLRARARSCAGESGVRR